jgi:hypothetical protein
VRSRGLKAVGRIAKHDWVQQYGGVPQTHAASQRLQQSHPDRALWLGTVGNQDIKINGCPSDLRKMAHEDWLASLANHSEDPTCELLTQWVCSPVTGIAPALFLRALRDLEDGEDVTWNYGSSAQAHHEIACQ